MNCIVCGNQIAPRPRARKFCSADCQMVAVYIRTSPLMVKRFRFIVEDRRLDGARMNPGTLHHFVDNGLLKLHDKYLYVTERGLRFYDYLQTVTIIPERAS